MSVSIIAAVAANGTIGRDGDLPWHLPADLRHFKRLTMGHHLVMGRRTWESLGKALPGRTIVVVSHNPQQDEDGVMWASNLEEAVARAGDDDEVFIAGGGEIYRQALTKADRIYLTRIHADIDGDTHFPDFDRSQWQVVSEEHHPPDDRHAYSMTFVTLKRS